MPKIIEVMNEKGYSPDQYGMCYGLAAMGAQAVIRQDGDKFAQRIIAIKNINTTPEKENELDLNAFFDGVSVYYASTGMPLDFFNALGVKDTQNIIDSSAIFRPLENGCEICGTEDLLSIHVAI